MSPVWAPHGIIIYIDIVLSGISYAYSRVHGTSIIELHISQHTSLSQYALKRRAFLRPMELPTIWK